MSRYIDADVAIDKVDCLFRDTERDNGNFMLTGYNHAVADCMAILKNLDAVEAKHGHWEEQIVDDSTIIEIWQSARCSKCGRYHTTPYAYYFDKFNYCPNCGAKMDEVTE